MAYSQEEKDNIINRICNFISEEKGSLRDALCLSGMPDKNQFYKWIKANLEYNEQYARACEERADAIFEEILEIADENVFDVTFDDEGQYRVHGEIVQRSKLKIDARKWMLGKMNPKKYGDKIELDNRHSGEIKIVREIKS